MVSVTGASVVGVPSALAQVTVTVFAPSLFSASDTENEPDPRVARVPLTKTAAAPPLWPEKVMALEKTAALFGGSNPFSAQPAAAVLEEPTEKARSMRVGVGA